MVEIDILEQKPISLVEIKDLLDKVKVDTKELNTRAEKVNNYLNDVVSMDKKKYSAIRETLSKLESQKLRDRLIVKILDIMPEDTETLKSLLTGEAVSLKQEELKQILDILAEK